MGQNFSSRHDHYINRFSNPKVQENQKTFRFRGVVVPGESYLLFEGGKRTINPFQELISQRDEEHSVIILGIYVLYIDNETNHEVRISVSNLFVGSNLNQDVPHIDDIGSLVLLCPARFNGPVLDIDRIVYRPRITDTVLRSFAGMEEAIVSFVPEESGENSLLDITHPLVYFIIQNTKYLEPKYNDFHQNEKTSTYFIDSEFAKRAQLFFKKTIYNDLHKTRFNDTRVECELPKPLVDEMRSRKNDAFVPNVTVIIQVTYLSIVPGQPKMGFIEMKAD